MSSFVFSMEVELMEYLKFFASVVFDIVVLIGALGIITVVISQLGVIIFGG